MAILNSSGKTSSSGNDAWEMLEAGTKAWPDFGHAEKDSIIKHYAPKIRYMALRLKTKLPKSVEFSDLISAGTLGLMEALGKFKPELNIKFETYAENRIRGAMLDELRRLDWFSRSLRQKVRQLDDACWRVETEQGRPATEEDLQIHTGMSIKDIRLGLEALQNQLCLSLDAIQDTLAQDSLNITGEPYSNIAFIDMVDKVAKLVDLLTPREKLVLSLYYSDELTMREVAEVMNITEGRVSQLHSQGLTRIRREFLNLYGDASILE